jgi:hypothetical protein
MRPPTAHQCAYKDLQTGLPEVWRHLSVNKIHLELVKGQRINQFILAQRGIHLIYEEINAMLLLFEFCSAIDKVDHTSFFSIKSVACDCIHNCKSRILIMCSHRITF